MYIYKGKTIPGPLFWEKTTTTTFSNTKFQQHTNDPFGASRGQKH